MAATRRWRQSSCANRRLKDRAQEEGLKSTRTRCMPQKTIRTTEANDPKMGRRRRRGDHMTMAYRRDRDGLAKSGREQATTRARGRRHDGGACGRSAHPPETAAGTRESGDRATAASSESAWACNKAILQSFQKPRSEVWDRKDYWDGNDPEVSKLDRIFFGFEVAPEVFPELLCVRGCSDHNVTELFSIRGAFEVPLPVLLKTSLSHQSTVAAAGAEAAS